MDSDANAREAVSSMNSNVDDRANGNVYWIDNSFDEQEKASDAKRKSVSEAGDGDGDDVRQAKHPKTTSDVELGGVRDGDAEGMEFEVMDESLSRDSGEGADSVLDDSLLDEEAEAEDDRDRDRDKGDQAEEDEGGVKPRISIQLGDVGDEEDDVDLDDDDFMDDELDDDPDAKQNKTTADDTSAVKSARPSLMDPTAASPNKAAPPPSSSLPALPADPRGSAARRADPLQHSNQPRTANSVTIAAAYSSGNVPHYSERSTTRPYVPEKMACDIPPLLTNFSEAHPFFHTTQPLPVELLSLIESTSGSVALEATTTQPASNPLLLEVNRKIAMYLENADITAGPLPNTVLETALLPPKTPWHPCDLENLDKGLEAVGKNFTKISREFVGAGHDTFDCINTYYSRKFELRSVKVRKYRKKVQKEDEEYVKYVGGLGKYIALETKRMKAEKNGKWGGLPGSIFREGNEIKGLMSSVKEVADATSASTSAAVSAAAAAASAAAAAGLEDFGRGVRTRGRAAAVKDD